jgi:hypothetical protein
MEVSLADPTGVSSSLLAAMIRSELDISRSNPPAMSGIKQASTTMPARMAINTYQKAWLHGTFVSTVVPLVPSSDSTTRCPFRHPGMALNRRKICTKEATPQYRM